MHIVKFTLLTLLFSSLLAACGFKGPLYLPEDEPAAKPETTQDTKTEEKEDKEDEGDRK